MLLPQKPLCSSQLSPPKHAHTHKHARIHTHPRHTLSKKEPSTKLARDSRSACCSGHSFLHVDPKGGGRSAGQVGAGGHKGSTAAPLRRDPHRKQLACRQEGGDRGRRLGSGARLASPMTWGVSNRTPLRSGRLRRMAVSAPPVPPPTSITVLPAWRRQS